MKIPTLLLLAAATSICAAQERNDGATWHLICNQGTEVGRAVCDMLVYGYLEGVGIQAGYSSTRPLFCMPKTTTIGQASGVFAKYLADHPEERAQPVGALLTLSMTKAFPCK